VLPRPVKAQESPHGTVLASRVGPPLYDVAQGMLRYSNNMTAEVLGLSASRARLDARPRTLAESAAAMSGWSHARLGMADSRFVDHSGLGYGSRMTAADMVRILAAEGNAETLRPILRPFNLGEDDRGGSVLAKTGTHNFVSALAGYLDVDPDRRLAFAIFCADTDRRDAVPPALRERPSGSVGYSRRARNLQRELLRLWAGRLTA